MALPPDSHTPATSSAAGSQHDSDLTLNGASSAADAVPDLRLEPEVDASSTPVPEHILLERSDLDAPGAPAQGRPHVDIFVQEEADRSWLSRLRSLKTLWDKDRPRQSPYDEPVTKEAIANLEKHVASVAALRDVCTSIEQRLTRVEGTSGRTGEAAFDEALRDLCSQMSDRLIRVEETLRLTQKSLADSMLQEMYANIDRQLVQARMALQRLEEAGPDQALHELCQNIDARLERTESTLHRSEGVVAKSLEEISGHMTARFAEFEKTLQLAQQSLADPTRPETLANIERQLALARLALQRTEDAVADKTLLGLCQNIDMRLGRTEETLQRSEGVVAKRREEADGTLRELCEHIDARLDRTEDRLRHNEVIVMEWLHDFSTRMTARFAEADETIQRIERMAASGIVERMPSQQPSERVENRSISGYLADLGIRARAELLFNRFANTLQANRPVRLPWVAGLTVPVLVVVLALAIGALIRPSPGAAPEPTVAPVATAAQVSAPVAPAPDEGIRTPPRTALMANAPRTTRESRVIAPPPRSTTRASAPTTTARPAGYVGTLSITSVPSGAAVSINGKPAGKTPLRLPRQRAGSLAVQIAHDGFERWSAAVVVPADRTTQVSAKLRATPR